jgi:alpha-L-fucosidase
MDTPAIPEKWRWFNEARFGLFVHWGPYAAVGRGEQPLFRERIDQRAYAAAACRWSPACYDPAAWADLARRAGMKYAVLTTRHHDGFCLWDSRCTDYTSAAQAPGRDLVAEFADAFRDAGLRVGLYYSLADWRLPAYWEGPDHDPQGWAAFRQYVHDQVRELLTGYGEVSTLWFDGSWPHCAEDWGADEIVAAARELQPDILVNNRLGRRKGGERTDNANTGAEIGDFGTPEHTIRPEDRLWESCQVSTWRLWGHAAGERWRPADLLLDMLVECAGKGGNLLLNAGPRADGRLPDQFIERAEAIGRWMDVHGEAVYGTEAGEVCEFVTYGRQTVKGNNLYLVVRFWDGRGSLTLAGLETRVVRATLLTTGAELPFDQDEDYLTIQGLPVEPPTPLFPVIRIECAERPQPRPWAADRLWNGDPRRMTPWAAARGTSVWADGRPRP